MWCWQFLNSLGLNGFHTNSAVWKVGQFQTPVHCNRPVNHENYNENENAIKTHRSIKSILFLFIPLFYWVAVNQVEESVGSWSGSNPACAHVHGQFPHVQNVIVSLRKTLHPPCLRLIQRCVRKMDLDLHLRPCTLMEDKVTVGML